MISANIGSIVSAESEVDQQVPVAAPELSGAQEAARAFANALKTCRTHGYSSQTAAAVIDRLHTRLQQFFNEHACVSLPLAVLPDALCYKGHTALELPSGSDPAFVAMIRSGLRQFAFLDAISREELGELIELLIGCQPDSDHYDIATLLWERGFDQISYLVVESFAEDLASPQFQAQLNELLSTVAAEVPVDTVRAARLSEDDLRVKAGTAAEISGSPAAGDVFDVSQEEEKISEVLCKREDLALGARLVNILLRLAHESSDDGEREIFELRLASLLDEELQFGRFVSVDRALNLLREAAARGKGTRTGQTAGSVIRRLVQAKALPKVGVAAAKSVENAKTVASILEMLGPETLSIAYGILPTLTSPEAKSKISAAMIQMAKKDPRALIRQLSSNPAESWEICVPILAACGHPDAGPALVEAYKWGKIEVRRVIIRSLSKRREPFVRSLLTLSLSSDDSVLRMLAYRHLSEFQEGGTDRRAADALFAAGEKDIRSAHHSRKEYQEILIALMKSAAERALQLMQKVVAEADRHPPELLIAMARVLGAVRSNHAQSMLAALGRLPSEEVSREVNLAMKRTVHAS
jgi:hypothetical protein